MSSALLNSSLGEFVRLQRGHDLTASEQQPGNVPIMGSAGPNGTHNEALAKGPGVVIGRSGASAGRVHFSAVDYWPHNTCLYVTDFLGNNPKFAYYLLQTIDLAAFNSGSAQPSLNRNFLYSIPLRVPQREEQDGIVDVLESLDDRITLLRETNATLEAIAQALFKSWFVDFDPVRAKMEGRAPEGMDEATAALFPDSLDETALGVVPRGWRVGTLGSVCSYLSRGISPKYLEVGGVLVLNQKCIRDFSVDCSKGRRHDPAQRKTEGREVEVGDVLVNSTGVGTLGRVAQVLELPERTIVDSHVTIVRAGLTLSWPYLGQFMTSKQAEIEAMGEGSTGQTELSRGKLAEMKVLIPDVRTLSAFSEIVIPLKQRIATNESSVQTLSTLRDTLLPRLISGQLRVAEAPTAVEKAFA
jgi:type I restriction enzyme S subunit